MMTFPLSRLAALASATALCAAGAAWAQETHPETGEPLAEDQSFDYRFLDQYPTIDPQLIEETAGGHVARQIFEGLMAQDAEGEVIPAAATGYEANEDYSEFTFTLREGLQWSDGEPVTAEDFAYAWRRAIDPATASEYAWFVELAALENATEILAGEMDPSELGVEVVDERTLKVTLSEPTPYFPSMMSFATFFPARQDVIEEHGDDWTDPENIVTNGAYTLAEAVPNEYTRIVKSDTYWDAANTVMEEATFHVINEENQALTRYLAGELDHVEPLPAGRYPELEDEYPEQAHAVPRLCSYYYGVNLRDGAKEELQDPNVRRALSLAIDRGVIVDQVLQGGQTPAYNFAHEATAGFEVPEIDYADMTQAERDEEARQLMEEAGVDGLEVELIYNTSESHRAIATVVSQMWKQKLGVETNLTNYEWQTYLDIRRDGQFDVARGAWCGDYNEASTFLDLFTSNNANNDPKYINADYDALLDEARTAEDPLPIYQQAEQMLAEDMPILPIYHYSLNFMLDEAVKGWPFENVQNRWYLKDLYRVAES